MSDEQNRDARPLSEDRDGPLADKGWHGGATFFEESGGQPAKAPEGARDGGSAGPSDALPASEVGTGIIPEDGGGAGDGVHLPESESDGAVPSEGTESEPQSWPGESFGSIPPPG